jgi:hypothetical protein
LTRSKARKSLVGQDLAQLSELGYFLVGQGANPLFFNQKFNSLPTPGQRELIEAGCKLGSRIEIFFLGHLTGGELAEVTTLFIVTPAFEQSSGCYIGFGLHGFNQVVQQAHAASVHAREKLDIQLVTGVRVI